MPEDGAEQQEIRDFHILAAGFGVGVLVGGIFGVWLGMWMVMFP